MTTIFHITRHDDWVAAQRAGVYRGDTLDTEGFVHCSTSAQVIRTANAFFRGQPDLVLLVIDSQKLASELRYESVDSDLFPHIYGPLNLDAVMNAIPISSTSDGTFELPSALNHA